jgi:hypothetical protein
VASISDEYDEQLVERYGGETALERIRKDVRQPNVRAAESN